MPDLIGEATAIAQIVRRAGLPRDVAADVLHEAIEEGTIVDQNPPPRRDLSDATYPCSPSAWDHLYPPKFKVAEVDALIASLTDSAASSQPAPKRVPETDLHRFLMGFADGTRTKAQCKAAAEEYFGRKIVFTNQWEGAWKAVPKEKKLAPGKKPSKPHNET